MAKAPNKRQGGMPSEENAKPRGRALSTDELVEVIGGKITFSDISIVKKVDKASPQF
jgi:hypothetical protein